MAPTLQQEVNLSRRACRPASLQHHRRQSHHIRHPPLYNCQHAVWQTISEQKQQQQQCKSFTSGAKRNDYPTTMRRVISKPNNNNTYNNIDYDSKSINLKTVNTFVNGSSDETSATSSKYYVNVNSINSINVNNNNNNNNYNATMIRYKQSTLYATIIAATLSSIAFLLKSITHHVRRSVVRSVTVNNNNKNNNNNRVKIVPCKKSINLNENFKLSTVFAITLIACLCGNASARPNLNSTSPIAAAVVADMGAQANVLNVAANEVNSPYTGLDFGPGLSSGQTPETPPPVAVSPGAMSDKVATTEPGTHANLANAISPVSNKDDDSNNNNNKHDNNDKMVGHLKEGSGGGGRGGLTVFTVEFERVETPFIIGVWILSASIAKIGFHMTPKLNKIFPESCLLIVVGVLIGIVLLYATNVQVSPLTPNTFFFYMLPPIILDAGYFMPNRLFFDHIGTILLMAVVGTIFNIATIGSSLWACGLTGMFNVETPLLDVFLFASLISAVDPVAVLAVFEEIHVNEILYIVVFGESLLNDAVTVVLYHMFEAYNEIGVSNIQVTDIMAGFASFFVVAVGGTVIGVIWGFATGAVTRFTDHVRVIEPIFIFVMAYLAYLNAEIFHMSGILAITFCGITMKNYVEANISHKSHTTVKYALKMLSSSSETIIFMFLGVATVNNHHVWNTWFILLTILFCSVFRIIGVVILTAIANRFRLHKLSNVDQFVMSYGGLRGAVAFALVLLIDEKHVPLQPMFVTTTIAVIYFTVFLQGITIKPLVKLLKVKRASKRKPTMNERIHERFMDHLMAGIEDIVGKTGNYNVRDKFKRFDNRFIRPYLIRDVQGAEPKILETYSKLTMKDAMDFMRRNPSTIGQMSNTESMSALFRNYTGYFGGSPSFSNLENCSRNLDMQELDYNPSKKDLTDAKIHHLLAEELKPYRRASVIMHRRLSYSRHAVDDRDLSTQVNYKMHMNIRRLVNDRKHHKRSKRLNRDGSRTQNHVSFPEFQQNGSAKQLSHDYINDVLHEHNEEDVDPKLQTNEDWDDGLTFTAKSSPDSDRANNNSLIAHITSLPGFDTSKARIVKHYSSQSSPSSDIQCVVPTAAETILPWRRDKSYQSFASEGAAGGDSDKRHSKDLDGEERVTTPTATESVLPWKRGDDGDSENGALKQNEFPAWASNKEYLAYNSPSATFLGGLTKPKQAKSVIGLFRRESSGSGSTPGVGGALGSDSSLSAAIQPLGSGGIVSVVGRPPIDKRSASICGPLTIDEASSGATSPEPLGSMRGQIAAPFPVTASHRRNTRRGSMLELSGDPIPEENYTKSLPDREKRGARGRGPPLLKLTTPKSQHSAVNPQATALLSTSSSESDDENDGAGNASTAAAAAAINNHHRRR